MISLRLKTIASLVPKDAYLLDIGTDHAYLPIYLYQNNITKRIVASDISSNVLEYSKKNLKKYHLENDIKLIISDGFKNVFEEYDIAVMAGMGTKTIIDIIKNAQKLPNSLIIASNNDYYELRLFMNSIGYKIEKEVVVKENNIYYPIIKYIIGNEVLTKDRLLFGISNNIDYYEYLKVHYQDLYNKSHLNSYKEYVNILNSIIEKIED